MIVLLTPTTHVLISPCAILASTRIVQSRGMSAVLIPPPSNDASCELQGDLVPRAEDALGSV